MTAAGTATLNGAHWEIRAQPHVMLRLRRVFGKVHNRATTLKLSNTPENCRDLQWFAERYPFDFEPADAIAEQASRHHERLQRLEDIVGSQKVTRSFDLALPPRDYQKLAAEAYLEQGYLLLGDDLGVGKTVSAIASMVEPATLPAVVVTPGGTMPRQWAEQIERFAPKIHAHVVTKGTPYELPKFFGRGPDVLVLNYHKLDGWAQVLAEYCRSMILDEVQELRHSGTRKYEAAKLVRQHVQYCLALSATPIHNYGGEIFNVFQVISPGALGAYDEFCREWCGGYVSQKARLKDPRAFGSYLREQFLMVRRTRQEVGRELPAMTRISHTVESDTKKLDEVEDAAAELAKIILSKNERHRGQKRNASEQLSHLLRQATGVGKAPYVADFVKMLCESGEQIVLCGWHREVYAIWESKLEKLNPALYTGSESTREKTESLEAFKRGDARVLLLSLRSGAGLDGLQHVCRTIVFGELDWSPAVHEQCMGRIHRDGQSDPVAAYYMMSEEGSDPIVADALGLKRQQVEGIRNPNGDLLERLESGEHRVRSLAEAYLARLKSKGR